MYLTVFRAGKRLRKVELRGASFAIGSDPEVDLALDDPAVARLHARLLSIDGRWQIVNFDRTTGLRVNGRKLSQAFLAPGDRCALGTFELVFEGPAEVQGASSPVGEAKPAEAKPADASAETLLSLLKGTSRLATPADRRALLEHMLDVLMRVFGVERCSVLMPGAAGKFEAAVTRNLDPKALERAISGTVVKRTLDTGAPIFEHNALDSPDLAEAASIAAARIRTVVCYPLIEKGRVAALLYLDSAGGASRLGPESASLLDLFGAHALSALANQHEKEELRLDVGRLREIADDALRRVHGNAQVVVEDPRSRELMRQVAKVAASGASTLITGESGTGKELIARAIHKGSGRAAGPFIPVNCGALPSELVESELFGHEKGAFTGASAARPGKFELAHGGTLFLDEVGELPTAVQVKLLRALQEREIERIGGTTPRSVDIRVIAATNADLGDSLRTKRFREDLYYRLNVFPMVVPALRERPGDIEPLARHFVAEFSRRTGSRIRGVDPAACRALVSYRWPGNVRELRNVIERAFVLEESELITLASLPFGAGSATAPAVPEGFPHGEGSLADAMGSFERQFLRAALERHGFNVALTAKTIGVARQTLYNKMVELGLKPASRTPGPGHEG